MREAAIQISCRYGSMGTPLLRLLEEARIMDLRADYGAMTPIPAYAREAGFWVRV